MILKTKKRFVAQLQDLPSVNENFTDLLESVKIDEIKEGTVVQGYVIETSSEVVVVDVGLKNEARIPISEFCLDNKKDIPNVGDAIDVYVEKVESRKGTILSRVKAIREKSWQKLEQLFEQKKHVLGSIFGRVKGGFTVDIDGVVAFLPGSQLDVRPVKDPSLIMDIQHSFEILKMDKKLGNIIVSRRAVLEESRAEAREEMLSQIKEGMILEGVVKNITDYGAFIDLGNIDGLLHVTDISWSRINHPSEILSFGQEVKVSVIKYNEETKRISLGMKQLDVNPWQSIKKEFPLDKVIKGKITNITDYGAFIELKNGIEGLVHSSEIQWGKTVQHPKKVLSIGQEVDFVVLDVDIEKHRVSLSIKKCVENPMVSFVKDNPVDSIINGVIRNITEYGMFISIAGDYGHVDGMVHESDISWTEKGTDLLKNYKKGDQIKCKVLSVDVAKSRIALGIKQLTKKNEFDELSNIKKNAVLTCKVVKVSDDGVEVSLENNILGFIKKSELSLEKQDQKPNRFAFDDRFDAKVISIDKVLGKVYLSVKAFESDERKRTIKEYGSTDSGASLGDILGAALGEQSSNNNKKISH